MASPLSIETMSTQQLVDVLSGRDTFFYYQFIDSVTGQALVGKIPKSYFDTVDVVDIFKQKQFVVPEQIPLQCYDNAIKVLVENQNVQPSLKFCIGLQQDAVEANKIVEHAWVSVSGVHYDSSSELENSIYHLIYSFTLEQLMTLMNDFNQGCVPSILRLIEIGRCNQ